MKILKHKLQVQVLLCAIDRNEITTSRSTANTSYPNTLYPIDTNDIITDIGTTSLKTIAPNTIDTSEAGINANLNSDISSKSHGKRKQFFLAHETLSIDTL